MLPNDTRERTFAEVIAQALVRSAVTGSVQAAREIADRTEGKPRQTVDVDMSVRDWRQLARESGIREHDVIAEARRIISESDLTGSNAPTD